jgi:hypothetical protein
VACLTARALKRRAGAAPSRIADMEMARV